MDSAELLAAFEAEANEYVRILNERLLVLEEQSLQGAEALDDEALNEMFRAAHSLKGMAATMGFDALSSFTHTLEDAFETLRSRSAPPEGATVDLLFQSLDMLERLLEAAIGGDPSGSAEADALVKALREVAEKGRAEAAPAAEKSAAPKKRPGKADADAAVIARAGAGREAVFRIEADRLDSLVALVGDLVDTRARLLEAFHRYAQDVGPELGSSVEALNRVTSELQGRVMKLRMVPVRQIVERFPRMMRDLAANRGKRARLVVEGGEVEIVRSIADSISEPLVHLLRNAVDHGIELPEERQRAGKPVEGRVLLRAQYAGNHFELSLEDDGKGLNPNVLAEKALEKGLVDEAWIRRASDQEKFNLIFQPGFSTAVSVDNVSGRGVGMDAVRSAVEKMNGTVEVRSRRGQGTVFTIRLPLSRARAIISGLVVESEQFVFVVPIGHVTEIRRAVTEQLDSIQGEPVLYWRDRVVPVRQLAAFVEGRKDPPVKGTQSLVIVEAGETLVGVLVDRVVGQQEVVVKTLGDVCGEFPYIAGASMLGDGRMGLILEVEKLLARPPGNQQLLIGSAASAYRT